MDNSPLQSLLTDCLGLSESNVRIQFHEWVVPLPLPFIPDSPLSPVTAVKRVIPGVVPLPLPFMPDSPLCLATAVKRVIPGVVPLPLPFMPDSPLCLAMAVKRVIPGVVLLPVPSIPDSPLCPVTAVKMVIPGVVLLPLPFISGSPQFASLQQLKGLRAFAFLRSPDLVLVHFSYRMFFKKVECYSLCYRALGQRLCLPLLP